jgi:hypothetical protein
MALRSNTSSREALKRGTVVTPPLQSHAALHLRGGRIDQVAVGIVVALGAAIGHLLGAVGAQAGGVGRVFAAGAGVHRRSEMMLAMITATAKIPIRPDRPFDFG